MKIFMSGTKQPVTMAYEHIRDITQLQDITLNDSNLFGTVIFHRLSCLAHFNPNVVDSDQLASDVAT